MGLLDSIAKNAGIAMRKLGVKSDNEEMRQRAAVELEQHTKMYQQLLESERARYLERKEYCIVTYMFTQVMLEAPYCQRDFSFLDQMPPEYRQGSVFQEKLQEVTDEYFEFVCQAYRSREITAAMALRTINELAYFQELQELISYLTSAITFLPTEGKAAASVLTECEDIDAELAQIRTMQMADLPPLLEAGLGEGITAMEAGDYRSALKYFLFAGKDKTFFDQLKRAILYLAQEAGHDEVAGEIYEALSKQCYRAFGISVVEEESGEAKVTLYPSVDMLLAEAIRYAQAGAIDQYSEILENWLGACGQRIDSEQFAVLEKTFVSFKAYEQENMVLEYMVKNHIACTPQQNERLNFLHSVSASQKSSPHYSTTQIVARSGEVIYDYRFLNWQTIDIQQYFERLILEKKEQLVPMVIDEWTKDVNRDGICWDCEQVCQIITEEVAKHFEAEYKVTIVDSGAAAEGWTERIKGIYVSAATGTTRHAEFSFLLTGEQMTQTQVNLSIFVLLAPVVASGGTAALCQKVIAVKEKHNPRVETFIAAMKAILIEQLEIWINKTAACME